MNLLNEVIPILSELLHILCVWVVSNHLESLLVLTSLLVLLAWANVGTVAATETVEWRWSDNEVHALECSRSLDFLCRSVDACKLVSVEYEWTDSCVRTYE